MVMTEAEICENVSGHRLGYVKGLGFGPKRASAFKSGQTSSQREVELEIDFLRLKYLWRLNKNNLTSNKSGLNIWRLYFNKEINTINNNLRRSCVVYIQSS